MPILVEIKQFEISNIAPCHSLGRFSSKSSSKPSQYCLRSLKTPVFDGLSGFLQLGVVFETSNIADVTTWVHFRWNQAVNLSNNVSEVQNPRFLRFIGFPAARRCV